MRRFSRILITAGPTRERIDSVRFISNFSTGTMGYELAKAALNRGYKVTLISGPTALTPPEGAHFIEIEGARQMERAVRQNFKYADCLFMASAVCDWRPKDVAAGKIKKGAGNMSLKLVGNPDILAGIGRVKDGKILVGFALEAGGLIENAKKKLKYKNLDLIAANKIGKISPFGSGKTGVTIIDRYGRKKSISNVTKRRIASELLDKAEELWRRGR